IRTYLLITGLFNLAMSLIWGIDTLFKLHAGLDIFQVMLTNAAFTLGNVLFEIPTGVVADTLGRRVSLLLCLVTLFATTLLYVSIAREGWGFWPFMWVSVFLGLGYTFYTGAVDAWLVDALKATGYTGPLESVFARGQMVFGAAMLLGTLSGGALGQMNLALPYLVRAGVVVPLFAYSRIWSVRAWSCRCSRWCGSRCVRSATRPARSSLRGCRPQCAACSSKACGTASTIQWSGR